MKGGWPDKELLSAIVDLQVCVLLLQALPLVSDPAPLAACGRTGSAVCVHGCCSSFEVHVSCRTLLQALLPQLPDLAPLVAGARPGKELFLRLLGRLLALSARPMLSPTQPAFGFVLDSYTSLLNTR